MVGGRGEVKGDPGWTQTLPDGLMLETWWLVAKAAWNKEGCRERPLTARWAQVWPETPFRHLQGAHKHPYNFPRNNKSVMSSTTFFSRHLRVLVEKLCFSQKCHFFGNKEVSFQPKIVALGRKCSHASNPSIPT